jgi:hypothetical protein
MGRYIQSRGREIVAPGPSWREIFVRKRRILPKSEKRSPRGKKPGGDEGNPGVAALRERKEEKRRGNDAPWKAWKTQKTKASFPPFPPRLEIRQKAKAPDFHISTASAAAYLTRQGQNMKTKLNSS